MGQAYIRHSTLSVKAVVEAMKRGEETLRVSGIGRVSISSQRMLTYTKGVVCSHCHREGHYFAVEKHKNGKSSWHLNLYHKSYEGYEMLMTSDHILAKVNGGGGELENRQCMCQQCNSAKGHFASVEEAEILKEVSRAAGEEDELREKIEKNETTKAFAKLMLDKEDTSKEWSKVLQRSTDRLTRYKARLKELEENPPTLDLNFEFDPLFIPRFVAVSLGVRG